MRDPARKIALACLAPCAVMTSGLIVSWPFTVDDAYISLRHAANLVAHGQLSFNPSVRVEAYSNFLHTLMGAGFLALGLEPVPVLKAIGALCALATVPVTWLLARRLGSSTGFALFAALLLSLCAGFSFWATAGLETAPAALLLTTAVLLFLPERRRLDLAAAGLLTALSLLRVDGPVYVAALGLQRAGAQARRGLGLRAIARANAPWCALFAALYGAYFLWRLHYFGHLFPTPIYFKSAAAVSDVGESHTAAFLRSSWPLLAVASAALRAGPGRAGAPLSAVAAALALHLGSRTLVLRDVGTMAFFDRYFIVVLPCLVAAASRGLHLAWQRVEGHAPRRVAVAGLAAGVAAWQTVNVEATPLVALERIAAYPPAARARNLPAALYLNRRYGPDGRIVAGDIGLIGYRFEGTVDDLFGLASYDFARFDGDVSAYASFLLERRPDAVVLCRDEAGAPCHYAQGELLALPAFLEHYRETRRFGRETVPEAHYVVYERRERLAEDGGGSGKPSGGDTAPRPRSPAASSAGRPAPARSQLAWRAGSRSP